MKDEPGRPATLNVTINEWQWATSGTRPLSNWLVGSADDLVRMTGEHARLGRSMKFTVEIRRGNEIVHRSTLEDIASWRAQRQAEAIFLSWKKRGADSARMLNGHRQEIFTWQL
jgi:hypothetical protein